MSRKIENPITEKKFLKFLSEIFLFKDLSYDTILEISQSVNFEVLEFDSGENIYTPADFSKKIGFVKSGECIVEKQKPDGAAVPLNVLSVGDSFGVLTLFSSDSFPTVVRAQKKANVLFVTAEEILDLVKKY